MNTLAAQSALTEQARMQIQARAAAAASTNSVVDAVICALIDSDIDQWGVSLDDWKGILFEAFQAAREARERQGELAA